MRYVDPINLHDLWPEVREGLSKVRIKSHGDWIPEDIYAAIRAGHSNLYLVDEGFVVITPRKDFDGITLFVWIAYGLGEVFDKYLPHMEEMGRAIGAKRIRFESSRNGWSKRFKYVTSIYEKEIP